MPTVAWRWYCDSASLHGRVGQIPEPHQGRTGRVAGGGGKGIPQALRRKTQEAAG